MTAIALKPYLNTLLLDPVHGAYWTLERDLEHPRSRTPYRLSRADAVRHTGKWQYAQLLPLRDRRFRAFLAFTNEIDATDALNLIREWKLQHVPLFNGYPEAYETIRAEAERRGLPKHYATDLTVHDRAALTSPGWAHNSFLWLLRTGGTQIIGLQPDKLNRSSGNSPSAIVNACGRQGDDETYWYYWDGKRLSEITLAKAVNLAKDAESEASK